MQDRPQKPLISLIVATLGREKELNVFLESLTKQTFDLSAVQVIVVDQNKEIDLKPILSQYQNRLHIVHIPSSKTGLSLNRNIGLRVAEGQVVAFPDDDCTYYPDTLEKVWAAFQRNPTVNLVLGRVVDRKSGKSMLRNWPSKVKKITKSNFFTHSSSITIFARQSPLFDERIGVGTYFGSYEDADFVYRVLLRDGAALYDPSVEVWHEDQNIHVFDENKLQQYGLGFGALVRKHLSPVMLYWFLGVLLYHAFGLAKSLLRTDRREFRKRWLSIVSRIRGFVLFPRVPTR